MGRIRIYTEEQKKRRAATQRLRRLEKIQNDPEFSKKEYEKRKEYTKEWRSNNKERKNQLERNRYNKHKTDKDFMDKMYQKKKETRLNNLEEYREKGRNYYYENKERIKENARIWYEKSRISNPHSHILAPIRNRCNKNGINFNLEPEDIFIPTHCPILGIELSFTDGDKMTSPSVDRLVPELGYTKGNVAIISNKANMIKNCGSIEDHLAIAFWMKEQFLKNEIEENQYKFDF